MSDSPVPDANRSADNVFQVLSNSRRRRVISCLAMAESETMEIREIAAIIAAVEQQKVASEDVSRKFVTEIYHKLKDYHLEPLSEIDVIEHERETVSTGSQFAKAHLMLVYGTNFEL